jgi:hypothetical protein
VYLTLLNCMLRNAHDGKFCGIDFFTTMKNDFILKIISDLWIKNTDWLWLLLFLTFSHRLCSKHHPLIVNLFGAHTWPCFHTPISLFQHKARGPTSTPHLWGRERATQPHLTGGRTKLMGVK